MKREVRPMMTPRSELRPLYLNTHGARIGKSGAVLQVKDKEKLLQEVRIGEICQVNSLPFEMDGRNRRPPRDPVNAMLSLGYSLLAKDLTVACYAVGFDPYVGIRSNLDAAPQPWHATRWDSTHTWGSIVSRGSDDPLWRWI